MFQSDFKPGLTLCLELVALPAILTGTHGNAVQ